MHHATAATAMYSVAPEVCALAHMGQVCIARQKVMQGATCCITVCLIFDESMCQCNTTGDVILPVRLMLH